MSAKTGWCKIEDKCIVRQSSAHRGAGLRGDVNAREAVPCEAVHQGRNHNYHPREVNSGTLSVLTCIMNGGKIRILTPQISTACEM